MAFDSAGQVLALTTATTTTTGQWWTSTQLVGTPTRGLPLTLNLLLAATSATLGTASVFIQASDDGSNNIHTVGSFYPTAITDATATAIGTGNSFEQTITVSSPRQGYLRAVIALSGASPGYTAVATVRIGSSNPA